MEIKIRLEGEGVKIPKSVLELIKADLEKLGNIKLEGGKQ